MQVFRPLSNQRTRIRCEAECLPASFVRMPFGKLTVNLTHPFPPIRGWILQQLIKLAVAAQSTDDVIILVDSDIEFLRPTGIEAFARDGIVRFYRLPKAIDAQLPRHRTWHRVARDLLGLEQIALPFTDYISSLIAWDPEIVRQMLARVSSITGTSLDECHSATAAFFGVDTLWSVCRRTGGRSNQVLYLERDTMLVLLGRNPII